MNKLTKIGVSALCGSLAAVSAANAGALTVAGGATATWSQLSYGETGNPLGMSTAMTFTGTGELDNGTGVTLSIAMDDDMTYSAANITLATPSMGTIQYDEGGGTGIDRFDDMMPTAWEETTGTAVGTGLVSVSGVGGGTDIEWAAPADMLGDGTSLYISYSPKPDGAKTNDKGVSGDANPKINDMGYDVAFSTTSLAEGMNIFAGYGHIPQSGQDDRDSVVAGFTYAVGSLTVGYQQSRDGYGDVTGTDFYDNTAYGVSFAVNDDLSISYGHNKSERNAPGGVAGIDSTLKASSIQLAYSMGGASIKIAETSVDNAEYATTTAKDRDGTTIALSLAF